MDQLGPIKVGENVKTLQEMKDSTALLGNMEALRKVLHDDGYILLRNIFNREEIGKARRVVLSCLDKHWNLIDTSLGPLDEGHCQGDSKGMCLTGFTSVTHHQDVLNILEGQKLFNLFTNLLNEQPATFNNKWVRVHSQSEYTDEHTDLYRFANSSQGLHTCWIPLGDYTPTSGCLALCTQSHHLVRAHMSAVQRGEATVDGKTELPPTFERFNQRANWVSTNFSMGDLVIFDINLIHSGTENTTNRYRISLDSRWQPMKYTPPCPPGMQSAFTSNPQPSTGTSAASPHI